MTEYVVLIVGDGDRWWTTMSEEERKSGYAEYGRFAQQLAERGHRIVGGAELQPTTTIRTVQPGGATVTEGPFAETSGPAPRPPVRLPGPSAAWQAR